MYQRARQRVVPSSVRTMSVPAPVGGLNTLSAGIGMPPSDCVLLYNMIAAEYGLRSRLGSREWCKGLTGAADDRVRSVLPFAGSAASGTASRLFVTTSTGIWNATSSGTLSSADPADLVYSFSSSAGRTGHGLPHAHVTTAGHFLLYADEVNGLHVYTESTGLWTAPAMGGGGTEISGVDPADIVFIVVFKGRIWGLERDTANLWYSATGSLYGAWTKFALGTKLRAGGSLRCASNWTYDGGAGLDDALVVASDGGDVLVYQGTDPSDASTFGLTGVWQVGDLPAGREVMTALGGDLLLATRLGILSMSTLVSGKGVSGTQYETAKIANLFNAAMLSKASTYGWSMRLHPEDNALMVTVPEGDTTATTQLVMALGTKSWSRYRDLPIFSSGVYGGKLYFGTVDGSVYINDGYVDGVTLADPNSYSAVQYAGLSSFQSFGSGRQKQVGLIRPYFQGESTDPTFSVDARYDFTQTELSSVAAGSGTGDVWDGGLWDTALWGAEYSPSFAVRGSAGMGVNVALAWRGTAVGRTVLTGFDVSLTEGGFL